MSHLHPKIELLRRQYLQLLDPGSLSLPEPQILKRPEIQSQMYVSMFRDSSVPYPPPVRYRFRVLKRLVSALEEAMEDPDEDEISDDLTSALASAAASRAAETTAVATATASLLADEAQRRSYVTYTAPSPLLLDTGPAPPAITLLESPSVLASAGTTGLRTWEAAKYLASFLHSDAGRRYVRGRAVVELGAGTGLVGLFCARWFGARYVLVTDGTGEVVDALAANAFLNGLEGSAVLDAAVVKWGHALGGELLKDEEGGKGYGIALGADVTFDDRLVLPLVSTLHELFELYEGMQALIAATVRNQETLQKFTRACESRSFGVEIVASTSSAARSEQEQQLGLFHSVDTEIRIYRIWREQATS